MKAKIIPLSFLLLLLTAGAASAGDLSASIVPVYFAGETGVRFGAGVVVGDGSYVVTGADLAREKVGPQTSLDVKYPIVVLPSTGEVYRAETLFVDSKGNVAVLKIPVKGVPAVPIADESVVKSAPYITLGQMLTDGNTGDRWPAEIQAYLRSKTTGKLELKTWQAKKGFVTEAKGHDWLFLSEIEPADVIPSGALVTHSDSGAVAVYVSKFTIEGGPKPVEMRMTTPAVTLTAALQKAGASITDLRNPPAPTYKPDGKESQAFQIGSRAVAAILSGSWETAVKEAKALVALRADNANAQMLYGMALSGSGKSEEAVKAFDKSIELDPNVAGVYLTRGSDYAALKKTKEAEADYRKAMGMSPKDTRPLLWLSDLLSADSKRIDESVRLAERAVNMQPDNPATHLVLARVLNLKGDHEKAAAELKEVLTISPSLVPARAALGQTYAAMGKTAEAEKELRKLAEDEPKNPGALFALASFLKTQGKDDEVKTLSDKILAMNPPAEVKAALDKLMKKETDEKH